MGYFGSEFPAICNHFGIMAAWSRKMLEIFVKFWHFLTKKTTPYGKIFKILFQKFSLRHQSTYCVKISWNLADWKLVKLCVAYLTKKNKTSPLSPAPATVRITLKICQGQPRQCTQEYSGFIQIGSLWRSYSRTREHRQHTLWSESNTRPKPSFKPNND